MKRRKSKSWGKWQKGYIPVFSVNELMTMYKCTLKQAEAERAELLSQDIQLNDVYQVNMTPANVGDFKFVHLSIKRRDKKVIRDWRHFQRIKNELIGEENEGIEIYPAESRLVDTANQYHMFVALDPEFRFPFGFAKRDVSGPEEAKAVGARQRAFEEE